MAKEKGLSPFTPRNCALGFECSAFNLGFIES